MFPGGRSLDTSHFYLGIRVSVLGLRKLRHGESLWPWGPISAPHPPPWAGPFCSHGPRSDVVPADEPVRADVSLGGGQRALPGWPRVSVCVSMCMSARVCVHV